MRRVWQRLQTYAKHLGTTLGVLAPGCLVWTTPSLAGAGRAAATLCYLWADDEAHALNAPYTPDTDYSFNAQDGSDGIVTRTGTGTYLVTCTGVGGGRYLGARRARSGLGIRGRHQYMLSRRALETGPFFAPDFHATVNCFGRGGDTGGGPAPADSKFVLLFVWESEAII
jgi:hypothetical protein